jgi:hypothetical protein
MAIAIPASIRNNNPGAQYPGASSRKFGALKTNTIGGGHLIAQFPDKVSGAAALFDLLIRLYVGLSLKDAITKWSGGNSAPEYIAAISKATGLKSTDKLSRAVLADQQKMIAFAKAMAKHEAGQEYPMTDAEWFEAYALATGNLRPSEREIPTPWLDIAIKRLGLAELPARRTTMPRSSAYSHSLLQRSRSRCAAFEARRLIFDTHLARWSWQVCSAHKLN